MSKIYKLKLIQNTGKNSSSLRGPAWGRSNPDLGKLSGLDSPGFSKNWIATSAQGGLLAKTEQNSNQTTILHQFKYILLSAILSCLLLCCTTTYVPPPTPPAPAPQIKAQPFPGKKIALFLPLSGRSQKLGEAMLDASELAFFDFNDSSIQMSIFDTEGHLSHATKSVQKEDSIPAIIIGPVFAKTTALVAQELQGKMPIISFSNDQQLAGKGALIFGSAPLQHIEVLTKHALKTGIAQFYILAARSPYGKSASESIRQIALTHDATIAKTEFYSASDMDLSVQNIIAAFPAESDKTALIIIESGERLTQLLTKVAVALQNRPTQIIITTQLEDPKLLQMKQFEGAWFTGNISRERLAFEQNFNRKYGYKPPHMAQLSYDATLLGLAYAKDDQHSDLLFNEEGFAGVGGVFRFTKQGKVERQINILQINHGKVVVIGKSGEF